MKKICSHFGMVIFAFALVCWLCFKIDVFAQNQTSTPGIDPDIAEMLSTNPPPSGFATRLDYIKSFTNGIDLEKAYRSNKITKEEAMVAIAINKSSPADNSNVDTYGKVIDQYGEPVADAKIRGYLEFEEKSIKEYRDTISDTQGQFKFIGLHAKGLTMVPEKAGYEFNSTISPNVNRPSNYIPAQNNPLVFTMYKLRGGEPMKHIQINSDVPCDDSIRLFDLLSNVQQNTGDLMVKLTRNPLNRGAKEWGKPFNWTATFTITNGGLVEIPDNTTYPYEAPLMGYQTVITWNFPTNMVGWDSHISRNYYFKSQNGQAYGRMKLEIWAGGRTPEMTFSADIYANPSSSRNLEFDPSKQIIQ